MKRLLQAGSLSCIALVVFARLALIFFPLLMPDLTQQHFRPVFESGSHHELIFFVYPVIISFVLALFWSMFKVHFSGNVVSRAVQMAAAYAFTAIIPCMIVTYSVLPVTPGIIVAWLPYGLAQGLIAGFIYARVDP
jgi:phosphoglycerol transferase MdoB-like AlkP superfamily enzyme